MNNTISLGKELGYITSNITDVFTTNNYLKDLQLQYIEHVEQFYNEDFVNDFRTVYTYKKFMSLKTYKKSPCDSPLDKISEVSDMLREILTNIKAYRYVIDILLSDTKSCKNKHVGTMVSNVLKSLSKGDVKFKDVAILMDRHLGNSFTVVDLVNTIYSYGAISGLVDYYNFKEGKDG